VDGSVSNSRHTLGRTAVLNNLSLELQRIRPRPARAWHAECSRIDVEEHPRAHFGSIPRGCALRKRRSSPRGANRNVTVPQCQGWHSGTCMFDLTSSRRLSRARESRSVLFCQADNYLYYSRYNPQCVFPSRACSSTRRPSHGRVERLRKSRGVLLLALRLRPLARDCSLRPLTQELLHLAA
jgi:hypothetical protein